MKLIKPSAEYIPQEEKYEGMIKHIERCGRTCYKSEDKMTGDYTSAHNFVARMIKSGHTAMLEHGTLYLAVPITTNHSDFGVFRYEENPYSQVVTTEKLALKDEFNDPCDCWLVTTNYRVLVENDWLDDLNYAFNPTEYHKKRYTMKFICDRGVSHELVRHRVFSFAQESQRYCNYNKKDGAITFIIPSKFDNEEYLWECYYKEEIEDPNIWSVHNFMHLLMNAEHIYNLLINSGWKPQEARGVLPNATKTEIIMTGFEDDWKHFFDLRLRGTTGKPHPDMQYIAQLAWNEFKDKLNIEL